MLLFHYLFVAHMRIDVPALFDPKGIYHYWHGVNVTAVVWCFVGGGVYYLLPIGALPAVIVPLITGTGYLLTMRVLERMQPDSAEARGITSFRTQGLRSLRENEKKTADLPTARPPDFLWMLVALANIERHLSLRKGAHAVLSSAACQEIRVRSGHHGTPGQAR